VQTPFQARTLERDQAWYVQQNILAFSDRLFLSGSIRGDRSSNNGDPAKYYTFPAVSGSYRFVNLLPKVEELKLRAAWGETGNRPLYGQKFVTLGTAGNYNGQNALIVNPVLGNPNVAPERKAETEYGVDLTLFNNRVAFEVTRSQATITDALVQRPLINSSGLTNEIFNGGVLKNNTTEAQVVLVPIQSSALTWRSSIGYQRIRQKVDTWLSAPFTVPNSGFGAAYGRSRIAQGASTTAIWGNKPFYIRTAAGADSLAFTRDTIVGDATPKHEMFFTNTVTMGRLSLNVQVDWRKGGVLSNLTQNLFDEGQNSRDFDAPSPCRGATLAQQRDECSLVRGGRRALVDTSATATLGQYRYEWWNGSLNSLSYIQDGSFVKVREVALAYAVPTTFTRRMFGSRVSDVRLSLTGRNLFIFTDYWGPDPEVNNFGNNNVTRIVDLAPFPPSRQFFLSVDFGF
jgi:TonB-dependent starch-binding outer membrane protein SusC